MFFYTFFFFALLTGTLLRLNEQLVIHFFFSMFFFSLLTIDLHLRWLITNVGIGRMCKGGSGEANEPKQVEMTRLGHVMNWIFPSNSDLTPMFTPHFPTPTLLHTHSDLTPTLLWCYSAFSHTNLALFCSDVSDVFLFSDSLVFRELLLHWLTIIAAATLCHNIYPPLLFIFCTRPCSHSYLVALTTSP